MILLAQFQYNGWLAGGCNGTTVDGGGKLLGNTYIYLGGNTLMQHDTVNDLKHNSSYGGNLFGDGSGHELDTGYNSTVGYVVNSHVVIADSAYLSRNVYGGGNYGHVGGDSSNIQILGASSIKGNVYGGGNMGRIVGNTHVVIGDYPPSNSTTRRRQRRELTAHSRHYPLRSP